MMKTILSKLDRLLINPRDTIHHYIHVDKSSSVPAEYQEIGDYLLTDTGIHHFGSDINGELKIDTIYSVPFISVLGKEGIQLRFFMPNQVVNIMTFWDATETVFKNLDNEQKNKINIWISYCLMKGNI